MARLRGSNNCMQDFSTSASFSPGHVRSHDGRVFNECARLGCGVRPRPVPFLVNARLPFLAVRVTAFLGAVRARAGVSSSPDEAVDLHSVSVLCGGTCVWSDTLRHKRHTDTDTHDTHKHKREHTTQTHTHTPHTRHAQMQTRHTHRHADTNDKNDTK